MLELIEWSSFYVIVGSSAGALIGLQFVVLTLVSQRATTREAEIGAEVGAAFATPSVVHFAVVLLLSAIMSAPWHSAGAIAMIWGLAGLSGIGYTLVVARRMRLQTVYQLVFEDWLFHALFPLAAYALLAVSAYLAHSHLQPSLFLVGGATLVFLFVGIHNAWDATTYHIFSKREQPPDTEQDR